MAASFVYPPFGNYSLLTPSQPIDIIDVLFVSYNSTWSALNLTIFCRTSASSSVIDNANAADNPVLPSGLYNLGSIQAAGFQINQYPTKCSVKLTEFGQNDSALGGQQFWVSSAEGAVATTYSPSATTGTATTSTSSTSTSSGSVTVEASSAVSTAATTTPAQASTATTQSPSASASSSSGGLSAGAGAGIGVGAAVAVLFIAVIAWWAIRRRRKGRINGPAAQGETARYHDEPKPEPPRGNGYAPVDQQKGPIEVSSGHGPVELHNDTRVNELGDVRNDPGHRYELSS